MKKLILTAIMSVTLTTAALAGFGWTEFMAHGDSTTDARVIQQANQYQAQEGWFSRFWHSLGGGMFHHYQN